MSSPSSQNSENSQSSRQESQIAVVGMAGRFPGAWDLDRFWENLVAGRESITRFGDYGGYQAACGVLDDPDCFDAGFFGYAPLEGLVIDPQHRLFLECAWQALESAGYDPRRYGGAIGVYAGSSNTEYLNTLRDRRDQLGALSDFQLRLATGIDFLTTRVAYKFGLRGPAVTVQTACSTSLVAIHVATQALLAGECDMALAGGVTAHVPLYIGEYTDDGVLSPDGRCRAFDAAASGTIGGDGVGVVVLKRLTDALDDGDTVHAVVCGSAVNNDGSDKIGYTAPSVNGQTAAIRAALAVSDVDPETLTYVEAHGTGTPLGDPIEVAALTQALGAEGATCWLGSVKTNIGHTDAAAGVAGFIKAVLALKHGVIPPSLHFTEPNPKIDFVATRLRVSTEARAWDGPVRRAGVNSLGIGGTNAFVVLENAPPDVPGDEDRAWQLIALSARTPAALAQARSDVTGHLREHPELDLADVAWTLQTGRRRHEHRQIAVATGVTSLEFTEPAVAGEEPSVVFAYPGQGGQHVGLAQELYQHEPVFREALDECAWLFSRRTGFDIRDVVYSRSRPEELLDTITGAQACVFSVEHALTRLWQSWGVTPDVVLGHSLGAYAAATVAGTFELADAVALVAERSRLLDTLPAGAMMAVNLPPAELAGRLDDRLAIAVVNGPDQCVVSGRADAVAELRAQLENDGVRARLLRISTGGHSTLVEPVMDAFAAFAATVPMKPLMLPMVSDHTGDWLDSERAADPGYWTGHLRGTVRFADALTTALSIPDSVVIEVGPGNTLSTLARQHPGRTPAHTLVTSLPHHSEEISERAHLLGAAGRVWMAGRELDWARLHHGRHRRRVPLPTYPFERLRYRLDPVSIEWRTPPATADTSVEPLTATETTVAAAFTAVLGVPGVTAKHSFFELGGDSLLATQLAAWIRRGRPVTLSVRDVFRTKTVAKLAALIDDRTGETP